jgi:hypothetical protein
MSSKMQSQGINLECWFSEKMLNQTQYKKWNDNYGGVEGQAAGVVKQAGDALNAIMEDGGEEDDLDSEAEDEENTAAALGPVYRIRDADIPQAFSHFTYRYTRRKSLVCDLQGVLSPQTSTSPPVFEFTDPVIHYKSSRGRRHVFGRTDRGHKGITEFFKTHECSELCKMLNSRWLKRKCQKIKATEGSKELVLHVH